MCSNNFTTKETIHEAEPQAKLSTNKKLKIASWNVRTLCQKGKPENVPHEMERLQIPILGLSDMRWTTNGSFSKKEHFICWSGGAKHEKGVGKILHKSITQSYKGHCPISDRVLLFKLQGKKMTLNIIQVYAQTADSTEEQLIEFYNEDQKAISTHKSQELKVLMGDLNAKIGCGQVDNIVGPFGLGTVNEREKFIQLSRKRFGYCKHLVQATSSTSLDMGDACWACRESN